MRRDGAAFEAEGCGPFGYDTKHGRRVLTSYWRLPERLYDEPEELARWARLALGVARAKAAARAALRKPSKAKPKTAAKPAVKKIAKRAAKPVSQRPKAARPQARR